MSLSRSGSPLSPSVIPRAIWSLIGVVAPVSSAVTICRQARLLWRYCSIPMTAS